MEHECCYKKMLMNLNDLRQNSQHCDVRLHSSDGVYFMVHSIILSAWSKTLHSRLKPPDLSTLRKDALTLDIPELTGDVLSLTVQFMYGNVASDPKGINKLLCGLKTLGISVEERLFKSSKDFSLIEGGSLKACAKGISKQYAVTEGFRAAIKECFHEDAPVPPEDLARQDKIVESHKRITKHREVKRPNIHIAVTEENDGPHKTVSVIPLSEVEQNTSIPESNGIGDIRKEEPSKSHGSKVTKRKKASKHFCTVCQRQFPTLASYEGHQNSHKSLKPHCCRKCPKSFAYSISLRRHEKKCKGLVAPKTWECYDCKYSTSTLKDYKVHKQSHKKPMLQCSQCEKRFQDEKRLDSHIRSIHGPGHICSLCGKHVQSQSGYEQHMKTHEQKFPLHCHFCNKGFHNQQHFEGHVNKHQGNRPYMCSKCGQSFGYEQAVRSHEKRCSEGKKTAANKNTDPHCEICGLAFKNSHSLQGHMRGKHGSKAHQCPDCRQEFIWRQSYNRHRTSCKGPSGLEEEAAKVHCCSHCAMRFKLKTSLKEHIQAKHEAPRFVCVDCPARFNWKSSYYRHRRTSHSAANMTSTEQVLEQDGERQELSPSIMQPEHDMGCGTQIETNLELIGEYQADIEQQMVATATLLVEGEDITEVPLLDTVAEWQYTETFPYE